MRGKRNFDDIVAQTYQILQESQKARLVAEQELKKALSGAKDPVDSQHSQGPNFESGKLR